MMHLEVPTYQELYGSMDNFQLSSTRLQRVSTLDLAIKQVDPHLVQCDQGWLGAAELIQGLKQHK